MTKVNNSFGFTLIELLTVISLLSVMASVILVAINPEAQLAKARDSQRKTDIRQIQTALEVYRADNGSYPSGSTLKTCPIASPTYLGNYISSAPCTVTYLSKIPVDPKGTSYWNGGDYYYNSSSGSSYTLGACIENKADKDSNDTTSFSGGSGTCNLYYVVTNP